MLIELTDGYGENAGKPICVDPTEIKFITYANRRYPRLTHIATHGWSHLVQESPAEVKAKIDAALEESDDG